MILNGTSLGERQKDLNHKVNDVVARKVEFDIVKKQIQQSDVDILFKIDVAAKYKNTDYILEIFKSNDSLHISRALNKCKWLFDDEYSHIINVEYLNDNVFPHTSTKMKRKLLNTISLQIKNENQAAIFYNYCLKDHLKKIANKFLLHTSEDFKLRYIKKIPEERDIYFSKGNLKLLLRNSLTLADAYLEKSDKYSRDELLTEISYLYHVSNEKYLDLLEKYQNHDFYKLGNRITKSIAVKHKKRVLEQLPFYLRKLNTKTLVRNSTLADIKQYATVLLPKTAEQFWRFEYWKTNKLILSAIPNKERFEFVKAIFENKYPGEKFETADQFYTSGDYNLMTKEQLSKATENFELDKGNLSRIKRNLWYKSIPFDKAFASFQEKMLANKNQKLKVNLTVVLIKASKSQGDLQKILNYFLDHKKNVKVPDLKRIIDAVFQHHKVFALENECWVLLQKLLLDESVIKSCCFPNKKYESVVYLYHILHQNDFPKELESHLEKCWPSSFSMGLNMLKKKKQRNMFYEYVFQHHINKLRELDDRDYDENIKAQASIHLKFLLGLMSSFEKTKKDIPEIMHKYLKLNMIEHKYYDILKDSNNMLLQRLKTDAKTVKEFHIIKEKLSDDPFFKVLPLLRKLKIYFWHDIAKDFLNYFKECVSEPKEDYDYEDYSVTNIAVIGIFMLADESYKNEMMLNNVPESDYIDRDYMDEFQVDVQTAICRFGYFSRPPLISNLNMYFKGHYAKLCVPTLTSLFANLPPWKCLQLAPMLMCAPKYVLKRNFHLVLSRLDIEDLKKVVMDAWRNAENITVRINLFTLMFRVIQKNNKGKNLFGCLKEMVMDLHENDVDECLKFLDYNIDNESIPESIQRDLLESAWQCIGKFRGRVQIQTAMVNCIDHHMVKMNKEFVRKIVEENVQNTDNVGEASLLEKAKWDLTVTYLLHNANDEDTNKVFDLIDVITTVLLDDNWSSAHRLSYFVSKILEKCIGEKRENYSQANSIINRILSSFLTVKSFKTDYLLVWDMKLAIISNKVTDMALLKLKDKNVDKEIIAKDIEFYFSKEIGELVQELIEKNAYQPFYVSGIANKICNVISLMDKSLDITKKCKIPTFYIRMYVVEGLENFMMAETHLLALHILCKEFPNDLGICADYYKSIFERIKTFQSREVQGFLNQIFDSNGIKRRRLV